MTASNSARTIAITTSIIGGIALLALVLGAGIPALLSLTGSRAGGGTQTASADGIASVSVESQASAFTLRFDEVDEARLEVEGDSRGRWTLEQRGDRLAVTSSRAFWDFCFGFCLPRDERVTLTLPAALDDGSLDLALDMSAGTLHAGGSVRDLTATVGAGSLVFDGSANRVDVELSAGKADLQVADADEVAFEVAAGRLIAGFDGRAPESTRFEVSAGTLELTLPDVPYAVQTEVAAGSLSNDLTVSPRSSRTITGEVAAGSVRLRAE